MIVQWEGQLHEVSEISGNYVLLIKHCPSSFGSDIRVYLKKSQEETAINLKKGQMITYKARLDDWSAIFGLDARDGEIISVG